MQYEILYGRQLLQYTELKKRIIRIHIHKLVTAIDRLRKQHLGDEAFGLSPLLRRTGNSIADYEAAAYEESERREKLRLAHAAVSLLEECGTYVAVAEETPDCNTLKMRITAELVSIHLQSYINTLKK